MYQPDVLSTTVPPNFNAPGEFSVGGGATVTNDRIFQGIANLAFVKGLHSLKFGATTAAVISSPTRRIR